MRWHETIHYPLRMNLHFGDFDGVAFGVVQGKALIVLAVPPDRRNFHATGIENAPGFLQLLDIDQDSSWRPVIVGLAEQDWLPIAAGFERQHAAIVLILLGRFSCNEPKLAIPAAHRPQIADPKENFRGNRKPDCLNAFRRLDHQKHPCEYDASGKPAHVRPKGY